MPEVQRHIGDYEIGMTLGAGLQGKVKLGRHVRTGELVALKIIDKQKLRARELHNLQREVGAMERIDPPHPNCVGLRAVDDSAMYPKKDGTTKEVILLVVEYAPAGELFDYMMYTGQFPEPIAFAYFRQLLDALRVCHAHGVYHRDIKPENLLLDAGFNLKVADFGLSALDADGAGAEPGGRMWLRTECGTRGYMAPEILAHTAYDGAKADVWSAGVVLFIMLGGFPPFQQATLSDWWFKAVTLKNYKAFWDAHRRTATFSDAAMALLSKVFVAEPEERATVEELLKDPLLGAVPQMAPEAVKAELLRRKAQVDVQKARERERKAAEKEAEEAEARAQRGEGKYDEGKEEFDPFTQDVMRSASSPANAGGAAAEEGAAAAVAAAAAAAKEASPRVAAADAVAHTTLHSRHGAAAVQARVRQALSAMGAEVKEGVAKPFKTKASAVVAGATVSFSVEVLRSSAAPGAPLAVEVRRRSGDSLKYQTMFKNLQDALADILCGDPAHTAGAAAAKDQLDASVFKAAVAETEVADQIVDPFDS